MEEGLALALTVVSSSAPTRADHRSAGQTPCLPAISVGLVGDRTEIAQRLINSPAGAVGDPGFGRDDVGESCYCRCQFPDGVSDCLVPTECQNGDRSVEPDRSRHDYRGQVERRPPLPLIEVSDITGSNRSIIGLITRQSSSAC